MKSLVLFLALSASAAEIKPRMPQVSSVFPQGARPGTTLEVEVLGEYLDRATRLIFLNDGVRGRILKGSYGALRAEFQIEPEVPFGPHYFRVATPRGASNVMLFRVGDQPHLLEAEPNSRLEEAQEIAIPVTVNGRLNTDGEFDFYKFRGRRGETWVFDVRSARNGNGLDAGLILVDESGRKLEHSEDVFIWDPFFIHTFAADGWYTAIVQPTHRANDPNFAYQLDIRRAPHVDTVAPLAVRPGAATEATVYGAGLAGTGTVWMNVPGFRGEVLEMRGSTARVRLTVPEGTPDGPREFAIVSEGGRSNTATLLVEATPAHTGGALLRPPAAFNGIARYRAPERFPFEAAAGHTLVFEVRAQRFGSPVDSVVRILDASGKEIAGNDDGAFAGAQFNKDSRLSHTFEKPGRYEIELRNLYKTTGEHYPYQLVVRPPEPEFDLMMPNDTPYVYAGGKGTLKITAVRRDGHKGTIKLALEGLPAGVTANAVEIPAGKNDAEFELCAASLQPGAAAQVRVRAEGKRAFRSVRIASGGGEGAAFARIDTATLTVIEKPLFSLEAAATTVNLVRGGTAELPVNITRADEFAEPVTFSMENLPEGVTLEKVVAEPDVSQARLRLKAAGSVRPGRYPRILILGQAAGGQVQEAPKISVVID